MSALPTGASLGFLSHISGDGDPASILAQGLEQVVEAERLGFDSFWVTQHHVGAEQGQVPSPLVFLAAAAARTSRIRLGVAVVTLPLEQPLRVAEDAAVVDLLSQGRLELGLGPGGDAPSYEALAGPYADRRQVHREGWQTLRSALAGDPLTGGHRLTPHAAGLAERLWWATGSADGAAVAGQHGAGLLLARSDVRDPRPISEVQQPLVESYRQALPAQTPARVGISRTVVIADDAAWARRAAADGARRWLTRAPGVPREQVAAAEAQPDEEVVRAHSIYAGDASEVTSQLGADAALAAATDVLYQVQPAALGHQETLAVMRSLSALRHPTPTPTDKDS